MKFNRAVRLLEHFQKVIPITEAKKPFSYLSDEAQQVATEISTELNIPIENFIAGTKSTIIILDDDRSKVFNGLEQMGFQKNAIMSGSSAGGFENEQGIKVINKPTTASKRGSAGLENEHKIFSAIKEVTEMTDSITINFIGDNKTVSIENVTDIQHIGKEGESKGWKGDINLVSNGNVDNHISIKKDGGFRWESVMSRYRDVYETLMTKGMAGEIPGLNLTPDEKNPRVLRMLDDNGKPYGRIIVNNHPKLDPNNPDNDIKGMAFGPDDHPAILVQRTFTDSDFDLDLQNNQFNIKSSSVQETLSDFEPGDFPMYELERNASKATKTQGIFGRGILPRTTPLKMKGGPRANNLEIDYYDLMGLENNTYE